MRNIFKNGDLITIFDGTQRTVTRIDGPWVYYGYDYAHFSRCILVAPKSKFKPGDVVTTVDDPDDYGVVLSQNGARYSVQFDSQRPGLGEDVFVWSDSDLVLSKRGNNAPTIVIRRDFGKGYRPNDKPRVHDTLDSATKEAERLALANPGVEFATFSLATTSRCDVPVVVTVPV